jgi:hypothetical protein
MYRFLLLSLASLLVIFLLSCQEQSVPESDSDQFVLEEVARYGWRSLADSNRSLTDRERHAGGAVLGHPSDVAEGPDGKVYVLDGFYKKVVVFEPDGGFDRLILGGEGQGPGEFAMPRSLAVDPLGRSWVFDQMARRITEFGPHGEFIRAVPAPLPILDLAATSELVYGTILRLDDATRVAVLDTAGILVDTILGPGPDAPETGTPVWGGLGPGLNESVVFAYPRVGYWRKITGTSPGPLHGDALHPSVNTELTSGEGGNVSVRTPVEVSSAGELPGGISFIFYARNLEQEDERTTWLVLHDSTGIKLQTLQVPGGIGVFGHSMTDRDIFVRQDEPVPRIVRYRLHPGEG